MHAYAEKIGRNEPCPCGSGRKYKKCCWAAAQAVAEGERAWSMPAMPRPAPVVRPAQTWRPPSDERLVAFAEPLLALAETPRQKDRAIMLAELALNLSMFEPESLRRRQILWAAEHASNNEAERVELERDLTMLVERHRESFSDVRSELERPL
jgi:hypothetical protein